MTCKSLLGQTALALSLFAMAAFPIIGLAAQPTDRTYLEDLVRGATEANLFSHRFWHLLLHYRRDLTGRYTSEADDPGFFLSPNGKTDPQAELEATLARFFSEELVGRSRQPAQCAFIARYHWLKEKLSLDDQRLPPQRCERFQRWYEELNPQSVTLIFPSAFMNNPASMFGHTFLRVDQKGQTEQTRILAYTLNYAADVPEGEDAMYAVRGIFGGYKGFFSTIPYYMKVKEYRDIENRDILEYRLNFTESQIRWMLMHAWELGNTYFDYYFFKENCSYHLLALLEVADPTLHLRDRFIFWTVPADTVRLLTQQRDLVGEVTNRPARSTEIKRKRDLLSEEETVWLGNLIQEPSLSTSEAFARIPQNRQAFVLDVASDYLRYRSVTHEQKAKEYKNRNRAILLSRSERRVRSPKVPADLFAGPPEQGHRTSRSSIGVGWREGEIFEELTVRAGYHDLLDPDPGYTPDAQIELLAVSLRHYEERDQTRLERFTLANIVSLSPMDPLFTTPSWKLSGGLQTIRRARCGLCSHWNLNGGIGAAFETRFLGREVFFAFGEVDGGYSEGFKERHRVGGGATTGVLAHLGERWKFLSSGSYLSFPLGDRSNEVLAFAGLRYTLQRNWALRFEFNHRDQDNQGVFSVQAFF